MHELTEEWLKKINEGFSRSDIPHRQRPWLAWGEWAKFTGRPIAMNDKVTEKIFSWFERNTQAGSQQIGPMYMGTYYYDSCFWPIFVPVVYGTATVNARDSQQMYWGLVFNLATETYSFSSIYSRYNAVQNDRQMARS